MVKNIARNIVNNNIINIQEKLIENHIMFDDQFNVTLTRPVAREIPNIIEEVFNLDENMVLRSEIQVDDSYEGVFWLKSIEMSIDFLKEITEIHYKR